LGLIFESKLTKNQNNWTKTAIHSTEHLLDIINDIIDFTQVSAHRITLSPSLIELNELADEIDIMFKVDAEAKDLEFSIIRDLPTPTTGEIDLKRLRQVIYNLASNAIKFTDTGHVKIHFGLEERKGERFFLCNVSDSGKGLSSEDQKVIFKRFRQVGDTMSRQHGGIGLGLNVCQELAGLLGGTLTLTSTLNIGSLFSLCIPFPAHQGAEDDQPLELGHVNIESPDLSILLAEDNAVNQKNSKSDIRNCKPSHHHRKRWTQSRCLCQ